MTSSITRAVLLPALLALVACTHVPAPDPEHAAERGRPPNIVIVFTDDQGYADLHNFGGHHLHTPRLDRMAAEGVRLTSFYVAQPVCSASRAALLTGSYPNRVGVSGAFMPHSGKGLNLSETTLADLLRQAGYATGHFGKWHLGDAPEFRPNRQGFDTFYGILHSNDMWPHHPQQGTLFDFDELQLFDNEQVARVLDDQSDLTRVLTERSVAFIEQHRARPFFLYLAHPQPHVPLHASEAFQGASGRGLYADVIGELDWSVGEILDALRRNDLDRDTLVVFTSDNGPWLAYGNHAGSTGPFDEGKGTTREGGVRVPFIARWPGHLPAGATIDTPMMSIDLLPTIARLAGVSLPPLPIDGRDAWPVLSAQTDRPVQPAYFFYYGDNELQGVRYGKWKLYFPHRFQSLNGRPGGQDGVPVAYGARVVESIELYDVERDPGERVDLAARHPEVVAEIQRHAAGVRKELGDSLTGMEGSGRRPIGTRDAPAFPLQSQREQLDM
ncbi:sulfatase [Luteimonas sp. SJ-92]|uniref:Sulfatase n=1 Tax=Luteimonas salinisoli TaxID=2752307 RepID=A0A853JGP5_9GAMM|nr:sulfatase [Luteimonas salinisoli]NZA27737.1 sulfatase [Luteimonas salinisoli]